MPRKLRKEHEPKELKYEKGEFKKAQRENNIWLER